MSKRDYLRPVATTSGHSVGGEDRYAAVALTDRRIAGNDGRCRRLGEGFRHAPMDRAGHDARAASRSSRWVRSPTRPAPRPTVAPQGAPSPVACNTHAGACWKPATNARWQYQLEAARDKSGNCLYTSTGGINVNISGTPFTGGASVKPSVFDIDFQTDGACTGGTITQENGAAVAAIHANGAKAICYIDAGGAESFRPDYPQYQAFNANCNGCLFGRPIGGFRNEFWLNINNDLGQRTFILGEIEAPRPLPRRTGSTAWRWTWSTRGRTEPGLTISAGYAAPVQHGAREPRAQQGVHGGPEERRRAGARPRAVLRLRDQRAVRAVLGVRQLHRRTSRARTRPSSRSSTS